MTRDNLQGHVFLVWARERFEKYFDRLHSNSHDKCLGKLVISFISSDHVFNMWTQHIVNNSLFSRSCEIESPPGDAGCDG